MGVSRQLDFDTAVPGFLNAGRLIGISLPEAGLRTVSEALELSGRRFIFLEKAGFSDYFAVPTTRSDDFAVNVGNLAPQQVVWLCSSKILYLPDVLRSAGFSYRQHSSVR